MRLIQILDDIIVTAATHPTVCDCRVCRAADGEPRALEQVVMDAAEQMIAAEQAGQQHQIPTEPGQSIDRAARRTRHESLGENRRPADGPRVQVRSSTYDKAAPRARSVAAPGPTPITAAGRTGQ